MRTERIAIFVAALAVAFVPNIGMGQAGIDVLNPNLSGFNVDASAGWNVNGYYEYSYVLTNGPSSTGALLVFKLDMITPAYCFATGSGLPDSGAGRIFNQTAPAYLCERCGGYWSWCSLVPQVGLIVPALWSGIVTSGGLVSWGIDSDSATGDLDITQMAQGKVSPPMGLRSYDPPGFRTFSAVPMWRADEPGVVVGREDVVFRGTTFGPVTATSQELLLQTALMTYRSPTESVTSLAAGKKAIVIVHFKATVLPATFKATWNKQDVTSRFVAAPGRFAAAELTPQSGRNVLVISVSGTKSPKGTTTQTDQLIWNAP
ncbi:MAG TPA: hypothetical protein VF875_15385 [Anaeromyxobacter sp.]